jgi:hypothetical protein
LQNFSIVNRQSTIENGDMLDPRLGLCSDCIHMREINSDRGATFYRCSLSDTDPRFPKYPRLPVLHCSGHVPQDSPAQTS